MEVGGEEKILKIFHGNACYAGYKCATLVIHIFAEFQKVGNFAIYKSQI